MAVDLAPAAVVVEGRNIAPCDPGLPDSAAYTSSQVVSKTVAYLSNSKATISELTMKAGCHSVQNEKNIIYNVVNGILAQGTNISCRWGGIMLDEESGYGFTVAQLQDINAYAKSLLNIPGVPWLYTEDFVGLGDWSTTDYINVISGTHAAPEIYNNAMRDLVNRAGVGGNMVTWNATNAYPYNTAAGATGQVGGNPYSEQFCSSSGTTLNWENRFIGA